MNIFAECALNDQLNELSKLKTKSTDGWVIECSAGTWRESPHSDSINCKNWFGWSWPGACSLSTTLIGNGKAELDFGNCFLAGKVIAYINGNEIGLASADEGSKKIQFQYSHGSELKIIEDHAIIQFNSLNIIDCEFFLVLSLKDTLSRD